MAEASEKEPNAYLFPLFRIILHKIFKNWDNSEECPVFPCIEDPGRIPWCETPYSYIASPILSTILSP